MGQQERGRPRSGVGVVAVAKDAVRAMLVALVLLGVVLVLVGAMR